MIRRTFVPFLLAVLLTAFGAGPVSAATAAHAPLASYWDGFLDHWAGVFQKQNGIVMVALLVGVICLFIITRGKWQK